MRTDLLDSYLSETAPTVSSWFGHGKLVVVDLSDPFLDGMTFRSSSDIFVQSCFAGTNAAILFDIVLGIFVEWRSTSGRNKKIVGR